MYRLIIAVVVIFMTGSVTYAGTDYNCLNECTQKGHMYGYCKSQCSWDDQQPSVNPYRQGQGQGQYVPPPPMKQTDYQCLNECTRRGYMYAFCQERCSY